MAFISRKERRFITDMVELDFIDAFVLEQCQLFLGEYVDVKKCVEYDGFGGRRICLDIRG